MFATAHSNKWNQPGMGKASVAQSAKHQPPERTNYGWLAGCSACCIYPSAKLPPATQTAYRALLVPIYCLCCDYWWYRARRWNTLLHPPLPVSFSLFLSTSVCLSFCRSLGLCAERNRDTSLYFVISIPLFFSALLIVSLPTGSHWLMQVIASLILFLW